MLIIKGHGNPLGIPTQSVSLMWIVCPNQLDICVPLLPITQSKLECFGIYWHICWLYQGWFHQWETSLQSNAVPHWLGANLESALYMQSLPVWSLTVAAHYKPVQWVIACNDHSNALHCCRGQVATNQIRFNGLQLYVHYTRLLNRLGTDAVSQISCTQNSCY